jgi:hypothetical protein
VALSVAVLSSGSASAAADGLTWKISQHAFTSSSLAPAHSVGAPATKDPVNGFVFPSDGSAFYRPSTGEIIADFQGSATLGNFAQGGYRIEFSNLHVEVDAANNGIVSGDLRYCVSTADCLNPMLGPFNVTMTTFTLLPAMVTATSTHLEFTVTPDWASVGNQFHQEFIDALPPSLQGHFRATGSPADPNKPPAPITLNVPYSLPVGGAVTLAVSPANDAQGPPIALLAAGVLTIIAIGGAGLVVARRRS